jgi:hypothetical protein
MHELSLLRAAGLACALLLAAGCASAPPRAFPSPEAAAEALAQAARADSEPELQAIFGGEAEDLVGTGDPVDDANVRARFVELYDEQHKLALQEGGARATLDIGPDAWPFPVPLVKGAGGQWSFDAEAGAEEIVNRRIGRNELATIETCRAICDAQREYAAMKLEGKLDGEYAQRILSSSPEHRDGLFWPAAAGGPESPLGELVARAQDEGYARSESGEAQPYHGYFYRVLDAQGPNAPGGACSYLDGEHMTRGFAVLAWPAQYGSSGVMSFIVCANGLVYEADLGEKTAELAHAMKHYDPDERWTPCD